MSKVSRNDPCPCGSGKKFKQCCALRTASVSNGPSVAANYEAQISQALDAALHHHQSGRFAEAESIYRQILRAEPHHAEALHFYGVLRHQTGQHAEAVELIRRSIQLQPGDPLAHNNLGDAYRALQNWDDALFSFQSALKLAPEFTEVHNNIGETYRMMGRMEDAETSFQHALAQRSSYAEARHNLGLVKYARGQLHEAITCFQQAFNIKPDYAKAQLNLGRTYQALGNPTEAIASYEKALALKPHYPEALQALAAQFKEQGEIKKALLCAQRLLQIQANDTAAWSLYANIVHLLDIAAINLIDPSLLLQAMKNDSIDPQKLERVATGLICADPNVQQLLASANDVQGLPFTTALSDHSIASFIELPLLLATLDEALITDYRLEQLLTCLRNVLLKATLAEEAVLLQPAWERFACSLALQCFANEYLYALSAAEESALNDLTDKIELAFQKQAPVPASWLAIAASYQALYRLPFAHHVQLSNWQQAYVQTLLLRQLTQPLQEEQIKPTIPGLTGIVDEVSQAVRQQYEENPYPHWRRRGKPGKGQTMQIALQQRLPHQQFSQQLPTSPSILVAGCGTGSDVSQIVQSFTYEQILAVDISLSSLSYAKRATQELGIANLDFRHADILALGTLDRQFDLIVSSGVLHHMRDPLAGWRVLTKLLKPEGYMNIGLYSRRARRNITQLRTLIAEKGYPSTTEGIRQFRADVMAGRSSIDIGNVAVSTDFYSISACRDLIFHVQEHVYSPLEIQAALDELGLKFLGFEFSNPSVRSRYLARFPDNPACDSLADWEVVEEEHPDIFAGMYQFWVKKIT